MYCPWNSHGFSAIGPYIFFLSLGALALQSIEKSYYYFCGKMGGILFTDFKAL